MFCCFVIFWGCGWWGFEAEVPWMQTSDVSGPREARSRGEAARSAWPCWQAALSAQGIHPVLHLVWSCTAPTCCSFRRSSSASQLLPAQTSAHSTNPHVFICLLPLLLKTSQTHSPKKGNASSPGGKHVASPSLWVTDLEPSSTPTARQ